jgi:hypothetical protein
VENEQESVSDKNAKKKAKAANIARLKTLPLESTLATTGYSNPRIRGLSTLGTRRRKRAHCKLSRSGDEILSSGR